MRSAENRIVRPTAAGMKRVGSTAPDLATKTARSELSNGVGPAQRVASDVRSFTVLDWTERLVASSSYSPYSQFVCAGLTMVVAVLTLNSLTAADAPVSDVASAFVALPFSTEISMAPVLTPAGAPVSGTGASQSRGGAGLKMFFGFVEFDWDPDAPGGVPGFDSWPAFHNAAGVASR